MTCFIGKKVMMLNFKIAQSKLMLSLKINCLLQKAKHICLTGWMIMCSIHLMQDIIPTMLGMNKIWILTNKNF